MNIHRTLLAIETSCDETSVSIVRAEFLDPPESGIPRRVQVLAHIVESQTSHLAFGGVVPEVAARDHLLKITPLTHTALRQANLSAQSLDAIAVTLGPGLIGALMVGTLFAQGLSFALNKPLIGVNHVDAHLAPALLLSQFNPDVDVGRWIDTQPIEYPALALTVSGGHCHLSYLKSATDRLLLGHTADDACGEAFDKVAKLLGLPYPGGPHLEKLALKKSTLHPLRHKFPATLADKNNRFGFSYSGLKTQVLETIRKGLGYPQGRISGASLSEDEKSEIAAAFQDAAIGQLLDRLHNALNEYSDARTVVIAGGVAANQKFRKKLLETCPLNARFAPLSLCSDNATMIALHSFLPNAGLPSPHPFSRYNYSK